MALQERPRALAVQDDAFAKTGLTQQYFPIYGFPQPFIGQHTTMQSNQALAKKPAFSVHYYVHTATMLNGHHPSEDLPPS